VTGLSYEYTLNSKLLRISKTDGSTLTGPQTKAIVEAIQLKNTLPTPGLGIRTADLVLTDINGNSSIASRLL